VTLETESLLAHQHATRGGTLLRIDLAQSAPLGRMRGWEASRPVVQWSAIR
jgi:precorrin-6Y C5,15-methyltransferase (decarboxylating)